MDQNKALKILSDKERQEYEKLSKIFSSNLNENQLSQGIQYLKNNWKNYSKAMLIALLMNPSISSALETNAPDVYTSIRTEVGIGDPSKSTAVATPTVVSKYSKSFDFSNTFQSGNTVLTNKEGIQNLVKSIQDFTKGKDKVRYSITIEASESQVTNPEGYGEGELAQERADKVKQIFEKLGYTDINLETKVGTTPYEKGKDNPQDKTYRDEQYVKVLITLKAEDLCSFSQDGKDQAGFQGLEEDSFVTFDEIVAGKGVIEFKPGSIPDRIVIRDDNGSIKYDTGYTSSEKSQYSNQWKYVPLYVAGLSEMSGEALQGSKVKKITANTLEELVSKMVVKDYNWKEDNRTEVRLGLNKLQKLIDSGVKTFIIYDTASGGLNVPFNSEKGDSQVKVYSPLGKTGYNIKGVCKI